MSRPGPPAYTNLEPDLRTRWTSFEDRFQKACAKLKAHPQVLHVAEGRNVYFLSYPSPSSSSSNVLISAGIHGDEPASVEGVLNFLEREIQAWTPYFSFWIFPCLNPVGYVRHSRVNEDGIDLNRQFRDQEISLIRAYRQTLGTQRFVCTIALHEDYDAEGFYLYELRRGRGQEYFAPTILGKVRSVMPLDLRSKIDKHDAMDGFIRRSPKWTRRKFWPEAVYLYGFHTNHSFTMETPSSLSLFQRSEAMSAATNQVLSMVAPGPSVE